MPVQINDDGLPSWVEISKQHLMHDADLKDRRNARIRRDIGMQITRGEINNQYGGDFPTPKRKNSKPLKKFWRPDPLNQVDRAFDKYELLSETLKAARHTDGRFTANKSELSPLDLISFQVDALMECLAGAYGIGRASDFLRAMYPAFQEKFASDVATDASSVWIRLKADLAAQHSFEDFELFAEYAVGAHLLANSLIHVVSDQDALDMLEFEPLPPKFFKEIKFVDSSISIYFQNPVPIDDSFFNATTDFSSSLAVSVGKTAMEQAALDVNLVNKHQLRRISEAAKGAKPDDEESHKRLLDSYRDVPSSLIGVTLIMDPEGRISPTALLHIRHEFLGSDGTHNFVPVMLAASIDDDPAIAPFLINLGALVYFERWKDPFAHRGAKMSQLEGLVRVNTTEPTGTRFGEIVLDGRSRSPETEAEKQPGIRPGRHTRRPHWHSFWVNGADGEKVLELRRIRELTINKDMPPAKTLSVYRLQRTDVGLMPLYFENAGSLEGARIQMDDGPQPI